eukprot:341423-Amphidinium_carterae.3
MSMHYAPDFFKTITTQKRDDLRELNWDEEQVQQREQELRDTKLLELYAIIPQKAADMWITCGRVPVSYIADPTDHRRGYYNFHTEAHYAITDYMNLYMYNNPGDYKKASSQFTGQDFHFVVIYTTEGLLRDMTEEIASSTQRNDMTRWYARKDIDNQYQIKCGKVFGRISGWQRTLNVGKYMELKVVYRQQHRNPIENKTEYKQNHYHDYRLRSRFTHKQNTNQTLTTHHTRTDFSDS